jgi:hypothetical protein
LAPSIRFELWINRKGQTRLLYGRQVAFAERGKVRKAFDLRTRAEAKPDPDVVDIVEGLGSGDFSIDTILKLTRGSKLVESTPQVNAAAAVSADLVVFDVSPPPGGSGWLRIWALRHSRLPVHLQGWEPGGGSMDVFFSYSKEQPDVFFDPKAFGQVLQRDLLKEQDLAYWFLKDPGGQPITTEDERRLSAARAGGKPTIPYHLPKVKEITVTPEGAIRLTETDAQNVRPDGYPDEGFQEAADDLGRTYHQAGGGGTEEQWTQVFLPEDYPFDSRRPKSITLTARVPEYVPGKTSPVIGRVTLTLPKASRPGKDDSLLLWQANWLIQERRLEAADRVLDLIPEADALRRDLLRLRVLAQKKEFERAVALGKTLFPLLLARYQTYDRGSRKRGASLFQFYDYLLALAATGQLQEAHEDYKLLEQAPIPDVPADLGVRLQNETREKMKKEFEQALPTFAYDLLTVEAHLTREQLNAVLGTDVLKDPRFRSERGSFVHAP